jgi:hypothetical protein
MSSPELVLPVLGAATIASFASYLASDNSHLSDEFRSLPEVRKHFRLLTANNYTHRHPAHIHDGTVTYHPVRPDPRPELYYDRLHPLAADDHALPPMSLIGFANQGDNQTSHVRPGGNYNPNSGVHFTSDTDKALPAQSGTVAGFRNRAKWSKNKANSIQEAWADYRNILSHLPTKTSNNKNNKNKRPLTPLVPSKMKGKGKKNGARNGLLVRAPLATSQIARNNRKNIRSVRDGISVDHREFLFTLPGSIAFETTRYHLNPGLDEYPWLSTIAKAYDKYKIDFITFEFIPRTSANTAGSVLFAFDPDALDKTPATEEIAMSYACIASTPSWQGIQCRPPQRLMHPGGLSKYVRSDRRAGDLRLYDAGSMYICTKGMVGTNDVGMIFVNYRVRFTGPQTDPAGTGVEIPHINSLLCAGGQAFTTAIPIPIDWDDIQYNPLGLTMVSSLPHHEFTLPAGVYKFSLHVVFLDDTAELFTAVVYLYKNGAEYVPFPVRGWGKNTPATGASYLPITFDNFVVALSTDVWHYLAVVTAAAGSLSSLNEATRMSIIPA